MQGVGCAFGVAMAANGSKASAATRACERGRELFIHNLLVRIHFIIAMIRWTGLAPWEFEFPFRVGEDRVLDGPASGEKSFKGGPCTYCNPRT